MTREARSGVLLITGSLAGLLVMLAHPGGHDFRGTADPAHLGHLNMVVHGVAIVSIAVLFLGLLGLSRRLGSSDMALAALIAWGFSAAAMLSAAVASGFVATGVFERLLEAEASARGTYETLVWFTGLMNRGYATVGVMASSAAILLWSLDILRTRGLPRPAGLAGAVVGVIVPLALWTGHLRLDVHGFGMVVLLQAGWMIWIGSVMLKGPPSPGQ